MESIPGFNLEAFMKWVTNAGDTASVFEIQSTLITAPRRAEMVQNVVNTLESDSNFMGLYQEKYFPNFPTLEEMQSTPPGALGQAVAKHLIDNDITLDFAGLDTSVFYQKEQTTLSYMAARGIRTHDIYHAVLGLGTTPQEEYYVLSFQMSQFSSPYHMLLTAGAYIRTVFFEPEKTKLFLDTMNYYFNLGKNAELFPGYPFESRLHLPLKDVRAQLKLPEVIGMN